jgi:hypothetical protein
VAVLLEDPHPAAVSVGTNLEIEDTSPDLSPVRFEVNQVPAGDAGVEPPSTTDLESGVKWKVRLGALAAQ